MRSSGKSVLILWTVLIFVLAVGPRPADAVGDLEFKGLSYAGWWSGVYATSGSDLSLAHLAETGANWVSLIVTVYQDDLHSTSIARNEATPTDAELIQAINRAHGLGLKVLLKPHLDLWADPAHWRGEIGTDFETEAEWNSWFGSYRDIINQFADLAKAQDADMFCVGTELLGTTSRAADWREVIAGVRTRFPGPLIYASNPSGEETGLTWWDAVDFIGVDAYYPLATESGPSLDELKSSWTAHRDTLAGLAARWQKRVVLTEIGYRSIDGTASHPWDWQVQGTVDLEEQAVAYQAVQETFDGLAWFAGLFWWSWGTDPYEGGPCDDGFSPHDKPAEAVVRTWYGARFPWRPEPALEPDDSRTLDIYRDGLGPGWEDLSWGAEVNLSDTGRACRGSSSIRARLEPWGALSFGHAPVKAWPYYRLLEFCLYVPAADPPQLSVFFYDQDGNELSRRRVNDCRYLEGGQVRTDAWNHISIPLRHLAVGDRSLSRICFEDNSGQGCSDFGLDAVRLVGASRIVSTSKTKKDDTDIGDRDKRR